MNAKPRLVLDSVLRVLRPLVRLLLKSGVSYPAFAAALKPVFLEAARAELAQRGMAQTDSALTLLSGVHRRDVRTLGRLAPKAAAASQPLSLAAEVVARWTSGEAFLDAAGRARTLLRAEFDALVAGISSDVRPRAMLDELLRLGAVEEGEDGIALAGSHFTPRQGLAEMAQLFADNLADHAAAAALNLAGEADYLEQSVFVDAISAESARALHELAVQSWAQARRTLLREAQKRFDADAARPAPEHPHRARFGVYFFDDREPKP